MIRSQHKMIPKKKTAITSWAKTPQAALDAKMSTSGSTNALKICLAIPGKLRFKSESPSLKRKKINVQK